MQKISEIPQIYTDGSCSLTLKTKDGWRGPGGWGFCLLQSCFIFEVYGSQDLTTNNQMELTAVIEALKWVKKRAQIYTDSTYVQKGITLWISGWKRKGWKNVKNVELWKELEKECSGKEIEWIWVKAHNGDFWNSRADELANLGRFEIENEK